MPKRNEKRSRRIRNMIIICALIAITLSVSTYAWFIGMRSVRVSSFDVDIKAADSLLLSLDGDYWSDVVDISKETLDEVSYTGHTNNWGGRGLIPMSSIGEMDHDASRMILFEKASLTTTPGGYRLLASRVNNYVEGDPERKGYVVFDLFVKNITGTQYIKEVNVLDEEAIYLTVDSSVKVAQGGVQNTGIENSVRVAFAQIGRVIGTETTPSKITGITCSDDETNGVTGICRTAQIWEPNDRAHVVNAISWYDTSCLARTGDFVTSTESYSGDCQSVEDGENYDTYAVSDTVESKDHIDIYDGADYNSYSKSSKLVAYKYFTDSMKILKGTERPTFMTLAPNSITKVRIYIYIEGQDVDNYDFSSVGKRIAVTFGFTKERLTEEDIHYNGPELVTPELLTREEDF